MKHSRLSRAFLFLYVLACFLPGALGVGLRYSLVGGLFLFAWATLFMLLALHRTMAKPEGAPDLVAGALTGNWVYMLNVSLVVATVLRFWLFS
jgi:hypothetical protein